MMSVFESYDEADAYHGPAGEYVRRIESEIEVDRLSVLVQLVTALGVLVGRRVFTGGNGPRHYPNLFTLVVGKTGVGKGCASSLVQDFCRQVDPAFTRLVHGHPESTPGLIGFVSDGMIHPELGRRPAAGTRSEAYPITPVTDKRCLVICEEMQATIAAKSRSGSSLTEALKCAWDGKDLENNTKMPIRATDPHIGFIGHITPEELQDTLPRLRTDRSNGFTNRFLLVNAHRVRSLPFGGSIPACGDLCETVKERLQKLGGVDSPATLLEIEIEFAEESRETWRDFYEHLREGNPFLVGLEGFTERLAPIVKRVAVIYAVLDGEFAIRNVHLNAAIALCLAALDAVRELLPPTPGTKSSLQLEQKTRDLMNGALDWFTRTDVMDKFHRHVDAEQLRKTIDRFVDTGEWQRERRPAPNGHTTDYFRLGQAKRIRWTAEDGFAGITEEDLEQWKQSHPACNVSSELHKASKWLSIHPDAARRHADNPAGFFVSTWLPKATTSTTDSGAPDKKFYSKEFGREVTPAEAAELRANQRHKDRLDAIARKRRDNPELNPPPKRDVNSKQKIPLPQEAESSNQHLATAPGDPAELGSKELPF